MSEMLHHKLYTRHTLYLLQHLSGQLGDHEEVQNKPSIITSQSKEIMDLMHGPRRLPIQHILYLDRVHHNSF
jgi:exopolyphosphatase/pppGpp-phosphohydrolase